MGVRPAPRESRTGCLGTVFYEIPLDEKTASHIALGRAYDMCVQGSEDLERINHSEIHVDFMIGSSEVAVTGRRRNSGEMPLLRDGQWQM